MSVQPYHTTTTTILMSVQPYYTTTTTRLMSVQPYYTTTTTILMSVQPYYTTTTRVLLLPLPYYTTAITTIPLLPPSPPPPLHAHLCDVRALVSVGDAQGPAESLPQFWGTPQQVASGRGQADTQQRHKQPARGTRHRKSLTRNV